MLRRKARLNSARPRSHSFVRGGPESEEPGKRARVDAPIDRCVNVSMSIDICIHASMSISLCMYLCVHSPSMSVSLRPFSFYVCISASIFLLRMYLCVHFPSTYVSLRPFSFYVCISASISLYVCISASISLYVSMYARFPMSLAFPVLVVTTTTTTSIASVLLYSHPNCKSRRVQKCTTL